MASRADKNIRFAIAFDSNELARGMKSAANQLSTFEQKLGRFSRSFDKVGRAIQRHVVLPLAAIGGVSVKLAADFEASMQKIVALVGLPQETVDSFKEGVKDLAVETGRTAKELADAMFFITSAGIRGGESGDPMAVLAASAKAAAAGMGETKVVADALTSAVNAYGVESLSAAEATDVLVATIREGKLEADQVSQVIGKVIPIAAELGVEFNEVGAAIATMSRIGIDADVGSTALRAMLNGLLKPTADTEKAFREVGTSGEELRSMLADEGLLATLLFLQSAFEGNSSAMGRAFPNVRALTGVLGILADNAKQANFIFGELADNTGDTDRAFQAVTQTTQFKLAQAFTALKVAGIEMGGALAPVINDLADDIRGLAEAWSAMDEDTQKTIVGIGKWTLVIGVATVAASKLAKVIATIVAAWPTIVSIAETAYLVALGAGVGGVAAGAAAVATLVGTVVVLNKAIEASINRYQKERDAEERRRLARDTANLVEQGLTPEEIDRVRIQASRSSNVTYGAYGQGMRLPTGGQPRDLDAWAGSINGLGDAYAAWAAGVEEHTPRVVERMDGWVTTSWHVNDAWGQMTDVAMQNAERQAIIYNAWVEDVGDTFASAVGLFEEFPDQLEASFAEWETTLKKRLDATTRWSAALRDLYAAGLDDIAQEIQEFGPAAADVAEAYLKDPILAAEHEAMLESIELFQAFGNNALTALESGLTPLGQHFMDMGANIYDLISVGFTNEQLAAPLSIDGIQVAPGPGSVGGDPSQERALVEDLADKINRLGREGAN